MSYHKYEGINRPYQLVIMVCLGRQTTLDRQIYVSDCFLTGVCVCDMYESGMSCNHFDKKSPCRTKNDPLARSRVNTFPFAFTFYIYVPNRKFNKTVDSNPCRRYVKNCTVCNFMYSFILYGLRLPSNWIFTIHHPPSKSWTSLRDAYYLWWCIHLLIHSIGVKSQNGKTGNQKL